MSRIQIPVSLLEYEEAGNTLWIHGPDGATVLRIKTLGKIITSRECSNVTSHSDIIVDRDIDMCLVEPERLDGAPTGSTQVPTREVQNRAYGHVEIYDEDDDP